jgi:hypothetical protein
MATTLDERRQKTNPRPAAAMDLGSVDGAAPLNLTPPGAMRPDTPAPVPTQPAPQFTRTNAGPMLAQPPAAAPVAPAVDPQQQRLSNQTAMYVQGAQASAAARPAPAPAATVAPAAVSTPAIAPPAAPAAPAQPLDAQAAADAKMFGQAWDATKGGFQRAGAAIADVATLPVRAVAGAYDTAVIRPMRAAGIPAGFMSPLVNPDSNANGQSMTPFYDQFRARDEMAQTATNYGNEGRRTPMAAASPSGPRGTNEAQAKNPASDQGQVPGAAPPMPQGAELAGPPSGYTNTSVDGVYRKGNTFTDQAGTTDTAFQNRGAISPQNMRAAELLAANYNTNQQALARLQANNASVQPTPAAAPRQFDRAASIRALSDLRSPEAIALRNLRIDAQEEARDGARMGRAGRGNNAAGQAYAALLGELTTGTRQGQVAEMQDGTNRYTADRREEGATQRALMGEEGATRRAGMTNQIQQGELGLKREAQGFATRAAGRLEQAQAAYDNAKTDEERAAAAKRIRAIQGKGEDVPAKDRYLVTGGETRVVDGQTVKDPQRIFDTQTRQYVDGAGAAQPAAAPAYKDGQRLRGPDGKTYIVKNGQPVLAQ